MNDSVIFLRGRVVRGKKRGGEQLGIHTANYPEELVDQFGSSLGTGIYCGWASVDNGPVYKMVMSVGWNPYYKNEKKSMETHIIHDFDQDFYGAELSVIVLNYLRPEKSYPSLESLIEAIHQDIENAKKTLDQAENSKFSTHSFFTSRTDAKTDSQNISNGLLNGHL
ncbi:riboflavin kinase isoform X2 [Nematostella vectensis]|uniref:riboflavin kinase isoform X2 n=1 Tax=Nematostella vectensis TaxID=45351 RepID=UPI0020770223|nr:riboflavin kinase isoform X2 [Nematostella vectensis]